MRAMIFFTRLLVGIVFVYAGAVKVWDVGAGQWAAPQFAIDIANFRIVGGDLAILLSVYLPWVEIFGGLSLVFRRYYAGGLTILTALTLIFAVALGSAILRGLNVECGCFGRGVGSTPTLALARDFILLGALIFLIVAERWGPHSRRGYSESLLEPRQFDV